MGFLIFFRLHIKEGLAEAKPFFVCYLLEDILLVYIDSSIAIYPASFR